MTDFDKSIQWLLSAEQTPHHLEEAILGVIANMDKPSSPAGEAKQAFYNGLFNRTLEHRMIFRERVLSTTLADLRNVAQTYFDPSSASIGVITNRDSENILQDRGFNIKYMQ